MSFDIKFIRLDRTHVELARQAPPFLRCFWSRLINLISKDIKMVISVYVFLSVFLAGYDNGQFWMKHIQL